MASRLDRRPDGVDVLVTETQLTHATPSQRPPASPADVYRQELEDLQIRRQKVGLGAVSNPEELRDKLVGVSFSGGGLRSSCFALGVTQALQESGLWRYIDYLSTVSGGGYLGGYLASLVMKQRQPFQKGESPLVCQDDRCQPPDVQKFIYGGRYLLRPLEFVNKYLVGLFFINLAVLSGLIMICSLIAFLWRCFDYPAFRDRADLIFLGSDLVAPFVPFFAFLFGWVVAWVISYWRSGAEASGVTAKFLLVLMSVSLLIALALLLGNGDIATGLFNTNQGQGLKPSSGLTASLIGLVMGALIPLLNPKRLIESGINPRHRWERWVFAIVSFAMLVGVPVVVIGLFSRENISGYNNHPYRPVVAEDLQGWSEFCGVLLTPGLPASQSPPAAPEPAGGDTRSATSTSSAAASAKEKIVRQSLRTLFFGAGPAARMEAELDKASPQLRTSTTTPGIPAAPLPAPAANLSSSGKRQDLAAPFADIPWSELASSSKVSLPNQKAGEVLPELVGILMGREAPGSPEMRALAEQIVRAPAGAVDGLELARVLVLAKVLQESDEAKRNLRDTDRWHPHTVRRYLGLLATAGAWALGLKVVDQDDDIHRYWNASRLAEQIQQQLCRPEGPLNGRLLTDRPLTDVLLAQRTASEGSKPEKVGESSSAEITKESSSPETRDPLQSHLARARASGTAAWAEADVAQFNRLLLEERYPKILRSRDQVRRKVSIFKDQQTRLQFTGYALLASAVFGLWLDLNATSLHRYYRNSLAQVFLVPNHEKSPNVLLSDLRTTDFGAPYHLFSCSVSGAAPLHVRRLKLFGLQHPAVRAAELRSDTFLFSHKYCGSDVTGYVPTIEYENWIRGERNELSLAEVVALSGAAVSPVNVRTPLVSFLMFVLNLRLGQWIPNPAHGRARRRPTPFSVLAPYVTNLFRRQKYRPYCFLTDGGHLENLGLLQLIKRRCTLIFALDASGDSKYQFHDLARAVRLARIHEGVTFSQVEGLSSGGEGQVIDLESLDVSALAPALSKEGPSGMSAVHWIVARIHYPDHEPGWLVYIKPTLTGDEGVDIFQYRGVEPDFPQESSQDQMYSRDQVESYRRLGYHIGAELCRALNGLKTKDDLWDPGEVLQPDDMGEELARVYQAARQRDARRAKESASPRRKEAEPAKRS